MDYPSEKKAHFSRSGQFRPFGVLFLGVAPHFTIMPPLQGFRGQSITFERNLASAHGLFHFLDRLGDARAEHPVPRGRYQHVVLDADAAEVAVLVQGVVVDELLVQALGLPLVDQLGDEIDARLDRDDKALAQGPGQAQVGQAELRAARVLAVVAHEVLAEAFHVVNVHADHVPQAVGEEQRVRPRLDSRLHLAAHQAQVLEALGDDPAGQQVKRAVGHARGDALDGGLLGREHDVVDGRLLGAELPAHGKRAGDVGGVAQGRLRPGVDQQEVSGAQHVGVAVVVQDLPVAAEDHGVGQGRAGGQHHAFEAAGQLLLARAGAGQAHGFQVHRAGYALHGQLHLGDLLGALARGHFHVGADERLGGVLADAVGADVEQGLQGQLLLAAVGRQEMHGPAQAERLAQHRGQGLGRVPVLDPGRGREVRHARLLAHPDHVVQAQVLAEEVRPAAGQLHHGREVGLVQAEEVAEGAVLAEGVGVGGIVHRGQAVAQEEGQAFAHLARQRRAASLVDRRVKHGRGGFLGLAAAFRGASKVRTLRRMPKYFRQAPQKRFFGKVRGYRKRDWIE